MWKCVRCATSLYYSYKQKRVYSKNLHKEICLNFQYNIKVMKNTSFDYKLILIKLVQNSKQLLYYVKVQFVKTK